VAKWAFVPLEGGEDGAALVWIVVVVEQITRHGSKVPLQAVGDIGSTP
jgi:hypothetical protein